MKKLLLIEANGNAGEDLLQAARNLGVAVHVATHAELYEKYPRESKDKIAGTVFTDFRDLELARKALVEYSRGNDIDGVITGWEFFSSLATQVAADLGLPAHDPGRADGCRNKRVMADLFAECTVPSPRTVHSATLEGVTEALAGSGLDYPLVVKPAENAGSIGVSVVHDADELAKAFELAQGWPLEFPHGTPLDTTVLVQEYIGGVEFSVESVIADGAITHLAVTQKFTTTDNSRAELGHTVPADLSAADRATLLDTVEQAQVALGLRNGISHTEIKLVGPGEARIIELGARPPGDHIMKLVAGATGISEAEAYITVALGGVPDLAPKVDRAAAIRFLTPPRAGVFRGVTGIPEGVDIESEVYAEVGAEVGDPTDNVARIGYVILTGNSPDEVNQLADDVVDAVTVEVDAG
ncbi:carboxylase [Saccharothrix sp. ALI-22-I]|uniref:ATP-grasp domain-containing protein n=1 Tax=Saccharothrix sp. ALI-22-I TaxID=1933778 RepID=UPI00097C5807|nr:ATP-grasp domain-containing protein [Saccharothrix sp. ALI-22-I]ONI87987.1 carboxylase [Saccharothrix sp. ALI-22-I]